MLKLMVVLQTFFMDRAEDIRERRENGATAVEYGLMVALIAAIIVGVVAALGTHTHDAFNNTNTCLDNPAATGC
jgi:pilus assembly protein Flp/PilA